MDLHLALHAGTTAIIVLGASALVMVILVIAPWRTIRQEPPIPEAAETRLLLGEDFQQIEEELRAEEEGGDPVLSDVERREGDE